MRHHRFPDDCVYICLNRTEALFKPGRKEYYFYNHFENGHLLGYKF